ncbi:hypothetical protein AU375_01493 [Methylobacterium radiotolerans]|nr:hypothetical protein AU375_01493 [Methylobacterium radiotolerans]
MTPSPQPVFAAIGLCCPIGTTFHDTISSYAQKARGFTKANQLVGSDGSAPTLACCFPFVPGQSYFERLYQLFGSALNDCLSQAPSLSTSWTKTFELHVLLPAWMHKAETGDFIRDLLPPGIERLTRLVTYYGEEAHSLVLINLAAQMVRSGEKDVIFIAGLDSYINPNILDHLDARGVMFTRDNAYGFIPGEGCGVILITSQKLCPKPLGSIVGFGSGHEPVAPAADAAPIRGRGLASALQGVAHAAGPREMPRRVLTDQNGERWRAEQYGFAVSSVGQMLGDAVLDPECHCLTLGHLGSATGTVMVGLALGRPPDEQEPTETLASILTIATNASGYSCALMLRGGQRWSIP